MKLNVKAFSLTCGILWALTILLITYWIVISGSGGKTLSLISKFYFGYSVSWLGGIIGALWGFVDGFISGAVFSWLYNKLVGEKS